MVQEQTSNLVEAMQGQWRANLAAAQDQFVQNLATAQEQLRQNGAAAQGQARHAQTVALEQFRQNLATVQGEWQRAGDQARQALAEPFTSAQQAHEALFAGAERLHEQGVETATATLDAAWESWLALFGMAAWGQEQAEQGLIRLIEQGRVSREEGTRVLRELGEQARRNGREVQHLAQEGVRAGRQALRFPETFGAPIPNAPAQPTITAEEFEALNRKIDDLNQKLDAMTAKTPAPKATK